MRSPLVMAVAVLMALAGSFLPGRAQDDAARLRPSAGRSPCEFRSIAVLPVSDTKALGYSNNTRCVVDAAGNAWIAVRSKHAGEYSICLVRATPPWRDGMPVEQTWLEDRDSLQLSALPQ